MKKKRLRGSMTIEAAFIVPLILFVLAELITLFFFYHDKNIINGAAYETAVVGSANAREKETLTEQELKEYCKTRMKGKCIFFRHQEISVEIEKNEIVVDVVARKGRISAHVKKRSPVTEPEKRIRDLRRLENMNGEKNNA
ncbi:MAG: pilus assembly protein [Lachnospiraceae bacterium]|nr:pilus assembly protein [Lachnospiraceae bacterium]